MAVRMYPYTLINYFDVWKDPDGTWTVNNQCTEYDDIHIPEDVTPKEILEYLKFLRLLNTSDMRKLEVIDSGDLIEINQKRDHMPLFALMLKY